MRPDRALLLVVSMLVAAARLAAQDSAAVRPVTVTYLTATTAYIDAGRLDGLHEGDTLRVMRGGTEAGRVRVSYLASRQAACDIVTQTSPLVAGDTVAVTRAAAAPSLAEGGAGTPARAALASRHSGSGIRGRVGTRYLGVWQRDGSGGRFSQPSFDVRLDAQSLGGSPVGFVLDLRTRRTVSSRPTARGRWTAAPGSIRAPCFLASPGAPVRVTAGRQFSSALASVSLFDGVMAELARPSWGMGAFAGSEPEPGDLGYSNDVRDYGGYVQLHSRADATNRWTTTLGGIGCIGGRDRPGVPLPPGRAFRTGGSPSSAPRRWTTTGRGNRRWASSRGRPPVRSPPCGSTCPPP